MSDIAVKYPIFYSELNVIAHEFIDEYHLMLKERSLSQSSALPDSMDIDILTEGDVTKVCIALASYWRWVEFGRGAGKFPPPDKIEDWINRTGLSIIDDETQEHLSIRTMVYLISRKIAIHGTKGKHIMGDVVAKNIERWTNSIKSSITQDINNRLREIFGKLNT